MIAIPLRARRPLAAALFALSLVPSAQSALFDDEEARKRIADTNARLGQVQKQLEDRVAGLEQQIKSLGLADLFNSVEQIKQDIARLRGQAEVLTYELEQAQKRQRDLYVDLDTRLRKLEAGPPAAAAADPNAPPPGGNGGSMAAGAPPPVSGVAPPVGGVANAGTMPPVAGAGAPPARPADPASEQRAYDGALDQFKRGDYPGAIANFTAFVRAFPRSPLAGSAQYWIGNAHYARKDYRAAISAQRQLLQSYPESPKVPDALLNIASAQSDLGDNAAARKTLEDLIRGYASSEAAAKAKARLGLR